MAGFAVVLGADSSVVDVATAIVSVVVADFCVVDITKPVLRVVAKVLNVLIGVVEGSWADIITVGEVLLLLVTSVQVPPLLTSVDTVTAIVIDVSVEAGEAVVLTGASGSMRMQDERARKTLKGAQVSQHKRVLSTCREGGRQHRDSRHD